MSHEADEPVADWPEPEPEEVAAPPLTGRGRDPAFPSVHARRIPQLDILRGVALLGILVINIRYFAGPMRDLNNPAVGDGVMSGTDFWLWCTGTLFFEDKMIALFSMLFGVGIALTAKRGLTMQGSRMLWLLLIGAVHAFLIWFGDILMTYAMLGLCLLLLQRLPAGILLGVGTLFVLTAPGMRTVPRIVEELRAPAVEAPEAPEADVPEADVPEVDVPEVEEKTPRAPPTPSARALAFRELFSREREIHDADYFTFLGWRAELNWWWHFEGIWRHSLWRCGGFMMLGMALFRVGLLAGAWRARTYLTLAMAMLGFGLVLTALGMYPQLLGILDKRGDIGPAGLQRLNMLGAYLRMAATIPVSLGIACLVLAASAQRLGQLLLSPLGAVGRMALSCYLMHSIVCVVILEGYGLGHWGEYGVSEQCTIVAAIWLTQIVLAPIWLCFFEFGPVEWLWRSATWWRRQPFRRVPAAAG